MLPELLLLFAMESTPVFRTANAIACECAQTGIEQVVLLTPAGSHDITIGATPNSAHMDEEVLDREFSRHDKFAMLHCHPPTDDATIHREFPTNYAEAYDALSFINRLHSEIDTYTLFGMVYALHQVNPKADIEFYCVSVSDQETVVTKYDVRPALRQQIKSIPTIVPEPDDPKVSSLEIAAKILGAEQKVDEVVSKYAQVRAAYLQRFYTLSTLWAHCPEPGIPDIEELIKRINRETDVHIEVVQPSYK